MGGSFFLTFQKLEETSPLSSRFGSNSSKGLEYKIRLELKQIFVRNKIQISYCIKHMHSAVSLEWFFLRKASLIKRVNEKWFQFPVLMKCVAGINMPLTFSQILSIPSPLFRTQEYLGKKCAA